MNRNTTRLICLLAFTVLIVSGSAFSAAEEISVSVELSRDTIGLDEQTSMTVEVSGSAQNLPEPSMPTLPQFEVVPQGRSMNYMNNNGVVTTSVTYRFVLRPLKSGTFPIDNISVVMDNRRYKGNRVVVTVLNRGSSAPPTVSGKATDADGGSRDYFLLAEVDKKDPYVNEQVTLSLKFYIAVQHFRSPELTEPTTTGFWTEVLGNSSPFYQRINGRRYKVIERKYALFPTQTGELTIGRARIQANVASRSRRSRDPFDAFGGFFGRGEEVTVSSQPIVVNVKPLPAASKPADFSGTIGRFQIHAVPDKTEVEVNQPVTVTVKISGTGNIKSVAKPDFPELDDFRVYEASTSETTSRSDDVLGGVKTFEEVFIPNRPGMVEIPAMELTYFDPTSERYRRVTTRPISLNVTKPEGYTGQMAELPYGGGDFTISSQASDIRYISEDPGDLESSGELVLFQPVYLLVNGFPVLVLVGLVVARKRRERMAANVGLARSRAANKVARKRLAKAKALAAPATMEEFFAEIYRALTSYVADKLNVSPHGLTAEHIVQMVSERASDDALADDVKRLLQQCDFARFAPASVKDSDIAESLQLGESVITRMEEVRFG